MKEMLKSKFMVLFVVFVVGFSYINANKMSVLENDDTKVEVLYQEVK